ncbi:MAG: minor capsid protein [Ignavibacteria bacterium]|nr:minor capsid protein [Ignavibacteria bacterium]
MNLKVYLIIGESLSKGIDKAYRKGIASIVKLNKKEILRLSDDPELFKINYTGTDKIALMNFKVEAFTVAGVMSYELENKLKKLAAELQEGNHPLAKGEKDIKKVWVAEAYNIMADYIPIPDMPAPRFLNTNLRTAMQSSYHAAQYIRLQDDSVKNLYPAYQYKTLNDNRVREEHLSLHDMIWRNDDPVWDKIWPPNGWNCRCYVSPLNQEEFDNSAVQPRTVTEERVNEIVSQGKIGKDFQKNPGKTMSIWGGWLKAKVKTLPIEIANEIQSRASTSYGTSKNFPKRMPKPLVNAVPDFVFDKISDNVTYKFGKGKSSQYSYTNKVLTQAEKWGRQYSEKVHINVFQHEISHAIHFENKLRTPSETSSETNIFLTNARRRVDQQVKARSEYFNNKYKRGRDRSSQPIEVTYEEAAMADCIKAVTRTFGYGHSDNYFARKSFRDYEILANTGQMYLEYVRTGKWNRFLERDFIDLIPEIKKYWNKVYGKNY